MNTETQSIRARLDSWFEITKRKTNIRTEVLAGISTYLSLAYIFIVNPAILAKADMPISGVFFATVIASGLATVAMGIWARLPFALAPGLEMNGFVAFVVVGALHLTWQQALGAVFWSGVLCTVLSFMKVRDRIVKSVPDALKSNLAVSVGVFVMTIGLFLVKAVAFKDGKLDSFSFSWSPEVAALFIGFAICFLLDWSWLSKKDAEGHLVSRFPAGSLIPGSFLIAIICTAIFCRFKGIKVDDAPTSSGFLDAAFKLEFFVILLNPKFWPVFLVLFLIDFYGSIAKFIGLTEATNLKSPEKGVTNIAQAMQVDGIATSAGALVGTTSIITYVESAVGIAAGGRTGIVAIVCGILMLASVFATGLIGLVPVVATSGILLYVGWLLLPRNAWQAGLYKGFDIVVGLLMGAISFFTFSLDKAMVVGFGLYAVKNVIETRRIHQNPDWFLVGSFVLLLVSVVMQYALK